MIAGNSTPLRTERPYLEILDERLRYALIARNKANESVKAIRYQIKKERGKNKKSR